MTGYREIVQGEEELIYEDHALRVLRHTADDEIFIEATHTDSVYLTLERERAMPLFRAVGEWAEAQPILPEGIMDPLKSIRVAFYQDGKVIHVTRYQPGNGTQFELVLTNLHGNYWSLAWIGYGSMTLYANNDQLHYVDVGAKLQIPELDAKAITHLMGKLLTMKTDVKDNVFRGGK